MMKPMSQKTRWLLAAAAYFGCVLYFLFQGGKTALMLLVILSLLLIYLLLGRWSGIARVNGSRVISGGTNLKQGALSAGTTMEVKLYIRIPGFYPVPYVIVRDQLQRENGKLLQFETSYVPNWKRAGNVSYQTPPLQRGEYRFQRTECVSYDVFGLFEHEGSFVAEQTFSIQPQIVALKAWVGFRQGVKGPYSQASASRSAKETTQINGVREYHYGDRLSRIHWNATAKTGQWKSKAFERESLPRTLVILDRRLSSYAGQSEERFELAVSIAASFMEHGLKDDTAMGLVSVGESMTILPPKSGMEQRSLSMKHLTSVDADSPVALYASLLRADSVIEPGSFAVVISGEGGSGIVQAMEWLSRKGIQPCLIHVGSGTDRISGNVAWQHLLRTRGLTVHTVRHLQELPTLLEGSGIA
ncbi:hypothetical protein A7K91_05885 [Paenibacillus oryzae]|uniref:DUF58 domain-containing protein n=1 Tax=Paenibacillus oryzae TaxID=1844972 RepID=A0A1A5YI63_9BACL|nr:DUF58 domain-containing protein [Paenibacillus oryzae]OBR65085.1 hypothetical protein A7K91_05885 [Paenibacillus oryzae]